VVIAARYRVAQRRVSVGAVATSTSKTRRVARAVGDEAKEQRREAILVAAKRVFARKGFHATTVADVAKAAKLSYGSIYWYFDSKDALFHALMDAEERALRAHIAAAVGNGSGSGPAAGPGLFAASVRATFEFFESDRDMVRLLFRDSYALGGRFEKHLGGIYERFIDDIESVITDAQAAGLVIEAPPRMVAFSVAALIGQIALRRLSTDDGLGADVVADFVVSLVMEGLRPRD
jgi:AcrR family transcriptional regulator